MIKLEKQLILRLINRLIKLTLALTIIVGSIIGWHVISGGFSLKKITPINTTDKRLFSDPLTNEIQNILDQPFTYLSKGNQAYVFASKDNKFVIKLIRHHKYETPFWGKLFPRSVKARKISAHKERNWDQSLFSYTTSAKELQDLSKTLYTHLKPTDAHRKKLIIKDRLGRSWSLDLDRYSYIIQEKAESILSNGLLNNKVDIEKAQKIVQSYYSVVKQMADKGVYVRAKNCFFNLGIHNDEVQVLDLGAFRKVEDTDFSQEEILSKYENSLHKWAKKHFPSLITDQVPRERTRFKH